MEAFASVTELCRFSAVVGSGRASQGSLPADSTGAASVWETTADFRHLLKKKGILIIIFDFASEGREEGGHPSCHTLKSGRVEITDCTAAVSPLTKSR